MKFLHIIIFSLVLYSCSKKSDDAPDDTPPKGTVSGSIKAYDRTGKENTGFDNISIKLIDKLNQVSTGTVAADGQFRFEKVILGDVKIAINKPGYGFIDTVQFNHEKPDDTLSNIDIIEEQPFSTKFTGGGYSDGKMSYYFSCDYKTSTESYMATYVYSFSKYADASINHANLLWGSGTLVNVQYISGYSGGWSTFALKKLTDAGFVKGDKIYMALIPSIQQFWTSYNNKNINYKIISYKVTNASNVLYFILNE
jgi:hypothetical protein